MQDKSEIAIQTGETIRLRQVADFSAIGLRTFPSLTYIIVATSMDIGGSGDHVDYKKPSEDNYSSVRISMFICSRTFAGSCSSYCYHLVELPPTA